MPPAHPALLRPSHRHLITLLDNKKDLAWDKAQVKQSTVPYLTACYQPVSVFWKLTLVDFTALSQTDRTAVLAKRNVAAAGDDAAEPPAHPPVKPSEMDRLGNAQLKYPNIYPVVYANDLVVNAYNLLHVLKLASAGDEDLPDSPPDVVVRRVLRVVCMYVHVCISMFFILGLCMHARPWVCV